MNDLLTFVQAKLEEVAEKEATWDGGSTDLWLAGLRDAFEDVEHYAKEKLFLL